MEGFNPLEFDRILKIEEKGLKSVVLLSLGYRDVDNDQLSKAPKVRKNISDLIFELN
jgi:nitroreductase/dihydropteridine reductase